MEFLVILGGCLFAMYAGNYIAEENYVPIAAVLGIFAAGTFFFRMGTNMYLMIPVCWGLTGSISILPLPFNVRQLMIILATVLFLAGYIFKVGKPYRVTYEIIDLWIWINLGYLFTVFLRNPVGFAAIGGGGRVGGKPYIDVMLGVAVYLMLSRFRMPLSFAKRLPLLMVGVAAFASFAGALALFFPGVGNVLGRVYSDFASIGDFDTGSISAGETRLGFLLGIGTALSLYVVCRVNPVKLIEPVNIWWLVLYVCGVIMVLLSGFRNGIIEIFLMTTIAAMIKERWDGFSKIMVFTMVLALCGVVASFTTLKLPYTFQRALCFLPGNWDAEALSDAKGSSEWRYEIWRLALTTDRYIHSKVFGDGFGFSREEYERCLYAMLNGTRAYEGEGSNQEAFLIDGDFHSGPVTAIRFVGVVGLALLLPLFYMSITYAIRLIKRAERSPYQFCVLFFALPAIYMPLLFLFVFGDYRTGFVYLLFNIGMMKMLSASIESHQELSQLTNTDKIPASLSS